MTGSLGIWRGASETSALSGARGLLLAHADDWRRGKDDEGVGGKPACHLATAPGMVLSLGSNDDIMLPRS